MVKTIPKKKKCKKAKWSSDKALQIAEERRQVKGKGERERYNKWNADFQRIVKRNKAFLNKQCKEIEENSRMGNYGYVSVNPSEMYRQYLGSCQNLYKQSF